jgi:hypothetical protein
MTAIATLDGTNLPVQFRYQPPVPELRHEVVETFGGVADMYTSDNLIVAEGTLLAWRVEHACLAEWRQFLSWFLDDTYPDYTFVGYWDDEFEVKFHSLDPPRVKARAFDLSGSFRVVSVTSWGTS